jgi:hypothetical protein
MRSYVLAAVILSAACATATVPFEDDGGTPPADTGTNNGDGSSSKDGSSGMDGTADEGGGDGAMMADAGPPDTGCVSDGGMTFTASGMLQNGSVQMWTVPQGVCKITIDAFGAQGGGTLGGKGAEMKGDFAIKGGTMLSVVVGQHGSTNTCGGGSASGGGGGGSFVWDPGDAGTPLIAAGGGGGANDNWGVACRAGIDAVTTANGTQGNGNQSAQGGQNGQGGSGTAPSGVGSGGAGWLSNGGNSSYGTGCTGGQAPPNFTGGNGSQSFGPGGYGGYGGGGGAVCGCGGGGGYSGGGAGEGSSCRAGGGGGGSYNAGMNQTNTAGVQTGDGKIVVSW